jgi:hypothetical protein
VINQKSLRLHRTLHGKKRGIGPDWAGIFVEVLAHARNERKLSFEMLAALRICVFSQCRIVLIVAGI